MNLARAQLVETYRPTYASVNFSSGLPSNHFHQPDVIREPSDKDPKRRDKRKPGPVDSEKPRLKSRKNGHFVVAGEKGYTIWNNSTRPILSTDKKREIHQDKGKRKEDLDDVPRKPKPTEEAGPVKLCERGEYIVVLTP